MLFLANGTPFKAEARSRAPPQVLQDLPGRVAPGRPRDPAPRVRPRAAQVEAAHGRAVLRPAGHRAHEEELVEGEVAVEDVALGQAVGALEIEGGQHLPGEDGAR